MTSASVLLLLAKATVVLVAALGITRLLQHAAAGARHLVWLATLGALLLVPALGAWGPLRLGVLPAAPAARAPLPMPNATAATPSPTAPTDEAPAAARAGHDAGPPAAAGVPNVPNVPAVPNDGFSTTLRGVDPRSAVLALWAGVALAIGASLAAAWLAVRRIVRRARPLDAPDWRDPLWEVADRLGLADVPRLLRSEDAKMPFACGLRRPTIVLPAACDAWTPDRRRAVLLHELAHVRRRDLAGHTLARVVCAVYWFHPLVWTAARRLRAESERACDDLALASGARAADYAEHLLDIVASVRRDATPVVALAMARRAEFEGRMLDILDAERPRATPTRRQSAALVGALALLTVVVGAAAPVPAAARPARALAGGRRAAPDPFGSRETSRAGGALADETPGAASPEDEAAENATDEQAAPAAAAPNTLVPSTRVPNTFAPNTSISPRPAPVAAARPAAPAQGGTVVMQDEGRALVLSSAGGSAETGAGMTVAAPAPPGVSAPPNPLGDAPRSADAFRRIPGRATGAEQTAPADDRVALLAGVLRADTSASIRRIAAWGLAEYAERAAAAAALAAALRGDADADVRERAAWALANAGGNTAVEGTLAAALRADADARVRTRSAWALGTLGSRASADALAAALADPSPEVRARAAWALGNVGLHQAPRALVARLGDQNAKVRKLTAWALYSIEDPAAAPALQAAMRTERDPELQVAYIRALGAFGEQSVDALRGLLESPDARVKAAAVRALAGGRASGPWPWPWPEPRPFP